MPDEGYRKVVKLHDILYADKLFQQRALFADFVPHIGIGNAKDPLKCVEMVNLWSNHEFAIAGRVTALDVADYENDSVQTIRRLSLSN